MKKKQKSTAAGYILSLIALGLVWAASGRLLAQEGFAAEDLVEIPPPTERALAYARSGNLLWGVHAAWSMILPALVLASGYGGRFRDWAARAGKNWWGAVALFVLVYLLLSYLLTLPLNYLGFWRRHAFGLSNQSLLKWLTDGWKWLGISLLVGIPLAWAGLGLIRRFPRAWWWIAGGLSLPLMVGVLYIHPLWVEPLFNDFGPMKNKGLEQEILRLAERAGIPGSRVFEVEKSVDTKMMNAYVTGFGGSQRIVLWDTLLQKLEPDEVLAVVGHEIGHYVLGHMRQIVLGGALLAFVLLGLIHLAARALIAWRGPRWGVTGLRDPAAIPLILLLANFFYLLCTPAVLGISRHNELEADRFGLELTRKNRAAAMTFVKFQTHDLGLPRHGMLFTLWRASHPSLGDRIDFANRYRPWARGEPLRYHHLFEPEPEGPDPRTE